MTLVILALSGPVSLSAALWPLCRYLKARDALAASERAQMLHRIQAPELAPALLVQETQGQAPAHLPFDDDSAWSSYQDELRERVTHG